jgi:hypothetical protein
MVKQLLAGLHRKLTPEESLAFSWYMETDHSLTQIETWLNDVVGHAEPTDEDSPDQIQVTKVIN